MSTRKAPFRNKMSPFKLHKMEPQTFKSKVVNLQFEDN